MTLTIDLNPRQEAWLNEHARRNGVEPAEVLRNLVDEHMPQSTLPSFPSPGHAAAYLQARLDDEATNETDEIRQAQEELDEMKRSMNTERARAGAEPIF